MLQQRLRISCLGKSGKFVYFGERTLFEKMEEPYHLMRIKPVPTRSEFRFHCFMAHRSL